MPVTSSSYPKLGRVQDRCGSSHSFGNGVDWSRLYALRRKLAETLRPIIGGGKKVLKTSRQCTGGHRTGPARSLPHMGDLTTGDCRILPTTDGSTPVSSTLLSIVSSTFSCAKSPVRCRPMVPFAGAPRTGGRSLSVLFMCVHCVCINSRSLATSPIRHPKTVSVTMPLTP